MTTARTTARELELELGTLPDVADLVGRDVEDLDGYLDRWRGARRGFRAQYSAGVQRTASRLRRYAKHPDHRAAADAALEELAVDRERTRVDLFVEDLERLGLEVCEAGLHARPVPAAELAQRIRELKRGDR